MPKAEEICCICSEPLERGLWARGGKGGGKHGNNPYPVEKSGRACDKCDVLVVMPARLKQLGFRTSEAYRIAQAHWDAMKAFHGLMPDEWHAVVNDPDGKVAAAWNVSHLTDRLKK